MCNCFILKYAFKYIFYECLCVLSRENFVKLDVYMQELSYEEINQQPAYNMINLLGKQFSSYLIYIVLYISTKQKVSF